MCQKAYNSYYLFFPYREIVACNSLENDKYVIRSCSKSHIHVVLLDGRLNWVFLNGETICKWIYMFILNMDVRGDITGWSSKTRVVSKQEDLK